VITKAVGIGPNAEPDSGSVDVTKGDVILLCTDGLTTAVHDKAIADILCTSSKPKEACDRLVELALNNGGRDNITVVVGALGEQKVVETRAETKYKTRVEKRRVGWIIPALISLVIGIGIGLCLLLVLKPEPVKYDTAPSPLELAHLGYGAPEPLLSHIPLSGKYILLDQHGYIYVVNQAGKVLRVDTSGRIDTNYASIDTFKLPANAPSPMLATDPQGNLYFSDPAARKIMKFSTGGQFITSIGAGKLTAPESLAVDSEGNIFIIDAGRLKVIRPRLAEPVPEK
ncbi:MAG TPA: SpoIIE family protein phosphatase, partial [Armatimonadota bacterium]